MALDMHQPYYGSRFTDLIAEAELQNINHKPMASFNEDIHARSRKKRERLTRLRLENEHQRSDNHKLKTSITEEQGHDQACSLPVDLSTDEFPVEESNNIRENLMFLKDELVPDQIISRLFSDGILTHDQQEDLLATMNRQGREKCTQKLLNMLSRSASNAYVVFVKCLKDEQYFRALQKLQPNNTDITTSELERSRGKMPEPEYGIIQRHIGLLKQDIYPKDYITHLFSEQVLTEDEKDRLNTIQTNEGKMACVEAMLSILFRCGQFGVNIFMVHMKKENPSLVRKLYPDNSTNQCTLKYPEENHEVILDLERKEHTEFKHRTIKYLEGTLKKELPEKQLVSIRSLTKGCVQVTFEILSLDKTDKDKLQAVLEKAVKSGYIGPDAVAEKFTFQHMEEDELTDAEVEEEIMRQEEEKQRLAKEHDDLLSLRKNPRLKLVKEKTGDDLLSEQKEIRIVLLGKTATGKSCLGNNLLGAETFGRRVGGSSVTSRCQMGSVNLLDGKQLLIVDTPGLYDTDKKTSTEIYRCIGLSAPGPQAFILVLRIGGVTEEEMETIKQLQFLFGEQVSKHAFIVFTHKEQLDADDQTLDEYIADSSEKLKHLLSQCGWRYVAVDNLAKGKDLQANMDDVMKLIDTTMAENGGGFYTGDMYAAAEKEMQERMQKIKEQKEKKQAELEERDAKFKEREDSLKLEEARLKQDWDENEAKYAVMSISRTEESHERRSF